MINKIKLFITILYYHNECRKYNSSYFLKNPYNYNLYHYLIKGYATKFNFYDK